MSFSDIIGQDRVIKILQKAFSSERMAHAYLFIGSAGSGKKHLSYEFVKFINCLKRDNTNNKEDACETCVSCKKINDRQHPEVMIVAPEKTSISIKQIREVQKLVQYKQVESKYRCIIIDEVEKMTVEAANSFLKILEEPPKGTMLFLLAGSLSGILSTIISRCQILRFKMISMEEKINILSNRIGEDKILCKDALSSTGGSISRAELMLSEEQDVLLTFRELEHAYKTKELTSSVQAQLMSLAYNKEQFGLWLDFLISKEKDNLIEQKRIDSEEIEQLLKMKYFFNRNVNPHLLWAKNDVTVGIV